MEEQLACPDSNESVKPIKYAGFWLRVAATLIDGVIFAAVNFILNKISSSWVISLLQLILPFCYYVGFNSSAYQGTVGKIIVGIKITDLHGKRISFLRALARYCFPLIFSVFEFFCFIYFWSAASAMSTFEAYMALGLILLISLVFIVGYIMTAFTARKQALHDIVCKTLVVKSCESIYDEPQTENGTGKVESLN